MRPLEQNLLEAVAAFDDLVANIGMETIFTQYLRRRADDQRD